MIREKCIEKAISKFGCKLSSTGALVAFSGEKTGRSPKDKRFVLNETSKKIWWSEVNMPIEDKLYDYYLSYAKDYFERRSRKTIIVDAWGGWDERYRVGVRIYCYHPYHALFMQNMLIPVNNVEKTSFTPEFIIYNLGHLSLSSTQWLPDPSLKDTLIALKLEEHRKSSMLLYGTLYAGEMKKGVLTYMMWKMPLISNLPLHSSYNINEYGDGTFFFGLSGTGKTTLSADPKCQLIGDDEHVWTDDGVFNIEGGCYAKCIDLNPKLEKDIFGAIRYGAILENIVMDENRTVVYSNSSITQNTRASYPLSHINNALIPAVAKHPKHIIFLTCDASGLLPPVSKLTPEQAVFFFICGYTSKIAGTEIGITEPQPTFSACFGEPFLVWSPLQYGELLKEKLRKEKSQVYLLNTGWIGGPYNVGKRIPLEYSRAMVHAIHNETLNFHTDFPIFGYKIPSYCKKVPDHILDPRNAYPNKELYIQKLQELHALFDKNFYRKTIQLLDCAIIIYIISIHLALKLDPSSQLKYVSHLKQS